MDFIPYVLQVFDVAPEGVSQAPFPATPVLTMAYPRCLLAGSKHCALTLTLDGPAPGSQQSDSRLVRVFARHHGGAFLGRGLDEEYMATLACASTYLDDGDDALAEKEVFFSLDAPDQPGLIAFECEHEGGLMSNWKPVSDKAIDLGSCSLDVWICDK